MRTYTEQALSGITLVGGMYKAIRPEFMMLCAKIDESQFQEYGSLLERKGVVTPTVLEVIGMQIGDSFNRSIKLPNPRNVLFPFVDYSFDERKNLALLQDVRLDHRYVLEGIENVFKNENQILRVEKIVKPSMPIRSSGHIRIQLSASGFDYYSV